MKNKTIVAILILNIAVISCLVTNASAGEQTTGDYMQSIGTKFGRGLWNVVSSPAEIPCTIGDEMSDRAAAGFFTGTGKGIAWMLRRILVGVTEVGTFMIPMERTIPPVCHASSDLPAQVQS